MTQLMEKPIETTPKPRVYHEKIGDTSWELHEAEFNVFDDVHLWYENPRLLPYVSISEFADETELEAALRLTNGYDALKKSIESLGQMEPIYVWRADEDSEKYLVLEGATRVTILRELARKHSGGPKEGKFSRVKVKILPPTFEIKYRTILLARIHVRGSGVRAWGRYIQSKFIYEAVAGKKAEMSVSDMANYMEKSISWVMRLRDAYLFSQKFVEYIDEEDGEKKAVKHFSTLEEISKVTGIGPLLRDYDNSKHDGLRAEVFDMVKNDVFKEYRDARFLKQFHDDPDKWAQLKTGKEHIASKLAAEVKHNESSLKTTISRLEPAVERAVQHEDHGGLNEDDVEHLRNVISRIEEHIHAGVNRFRIDLKNITKLLSNVTLGDVKALQSDDLKDFKQALEYFEMLVEKYGNAGDDS